MGMTQVLGEWREHGGNWENEGTHGKGWVVGSKGYYRRESNGGWAEGNKKRRKVFLP